MKQIMQMIVKRTEGNNICIYRHIRLDTNKTFYIGIGSKERAYVIKGRNNYWKNITNKVNYEIQILKSDLTWEEACELEIILIDYYGRQDLNTGILVNLTNGGDGCFGRKNSKELRQKMSESAKNKPKMTKETKNKLSIINKGKILSQETKNKIGLANKGGKNNKARKIIDIVTNMIFDSLVEAAEYYNINKHTLCNRLCGYNKNKTNLRYLDKYELY